MQRWLFKIANKAAPTRRRRYVRKQLDSDRCLFCDAVDTSFHCLFCPHHLEARQHHWQMMYLELRDAKCPEGVIHRVHQTLRGTPAEGDEDQEQFGLAATLAGLWSTSFGLDATDRSYKRQVVSTMQILQQNFKRIYTHHVTQTYNQEHRLRGEKIDEEIQQAWDQCVIPEEYTKYHPSKIDVEVLLQQTHNVRRLWMDLHRAFAAAPAGDDEDDAVT